MSAPRPVDVVELVLSDQDLRTQLAYALANNVINTISHGGAATVTVHDLAPQEGGTHWIVSLDITEEGNDEEET